MGRVYRLRDNMSTCMCTKKMIQVNERKLFISNMTFNDRRPNTIKTMKTLSKTVLFRWTLQKYLHESSKSNWYEIRCFLAYGKKKTRCKCTYIHRHLKQITNYDEYLKFLTLTVPRPMCSRQRFQRPHGGK